MKRRQFITLLGGAAAWPITARAQQRERMRRVGVLMPYAADDAESQIRLAAFFQALALSGWTIGGNLHVDIRWAAFDPVRMRKHAAELVALAPDVILAHANPREHCKRLRVLCRSCSQSRATLSLPV